MVKIYFKEDTKDLMLTNNSDEQLIGEFRYYALKRLMSFVKRSTNLTYNRLMFFIKRDPKIENYIYSKKSTKN